MTVIIPYLGQKNSEKKDFRNWKSFVFLLKLVLCCHMFGILTGHITIVVGTIRA